MRTAQLGSHQLHLLGQVPRRGDRLTAEFTIPAARLADTPLTADELRSGLVLVSTLPNIQKHACMAQIVALEEHGSEELSEWAIVHVSADHEDHWREVDRFHPNVRAAGYSLCCADPASREAFVSAFGVGVEDITASRMGSSRCGTVCFWKSKSRTIRCDRQRWTGFCYG